MSAEISRIEIKIGEHTLSMTPDEAKELMHSLESIFDQPTKTEYVPYPMPYPQPYPVPVTPTVYPTYPRWIWTGPMWATTSGTTLVNGNTISVCASSDNSVYFKQ